jgi:hypothetical protein
MIDEIFQFFLQSAECLSITIANIADEKRKNDDAV